MQAQNKTWLTILTQSSLCPTNQFSCCGCHATADLQTKYILQARPNFLLVVYACAHRTNSNLVIIWGTERCGTDIPATIMETTRLRDASLYTSAQYGQQQHIRNEKPRKEHHRPLCNFYLKHSFASSMRQKEKEPTQHKKARYKKRHTHLRAE